MVRAPCKRLDGGLVDRQLSERLTVTWLENENPVVIASAGKLWIDFMRPLQTNGTVSMMSLDLRNLISYAMLFPGRCGTLELTVQHPSLRG